MNRTARVMLFVLCGQLLLAGCMASSGAPIDRQVSVGTHALHLYCQGKSKGVWAGSPGVVIETGSGETCASWLPLMGELARETRVCAYDRAGYGRSEPGPLPRDAGREADELRLLLQKAGVKGPYVLVGHSLGGLNAQVFASKYPDLLAGAVLLDPTPRGWLTGDAFPELRHMFIQQADDFEPQATAMRSSADAKVRATADFYTVMASEMTEARKGTAGQLAAIESFGDLPFTVVAATQPDPRFGDAAQAFRQYWNEQSEQLALKSTQGVFIPPAQSPNSPLGWCRWDVVVVSYTDST